MAKNQALDTLSVATSITLGAAGSANAVPLTVDPTTGFGFAAPRGSIGTISAGRRRWFKYGVDDTQWVPTDDMGTGLWPAILDARTAADVTAALAAAISGMTAAPDRLVQFDEASGAAVELINAENLTATGGDAVRVLTSLKNGKLDYAAHTVEASVDYWQASATTKWKTPATSAFAYMMLVKVTRGSGGYCISEYKQSGQAKGFYMALNASGQLNFGITGTGGVSTLASNTAGNHLNAWHLVIFGRSASAAKIYVCSDMGDGTAPGETSADVSNTDATFLLGYDLFGNRAGGITGDVSFLARFTGAAAEDVITSRVALCATLGGGLVTGTMVLPAVVQAVGASSPTAITGAQDNYAPIGFTTASVLRVDCSAAASLTGLAGGSDGRVVWLYNISTNGANTLTLKHDVTSTALNRFFLAGTTDLVIPNYGGVMLQYDSTSLRWRVAGKNF